VNSRCPTDDEVRICWLLMRVEELQKEVDRLNVQIKGDEEPVVCGDVNLSHFKITSEVMGGA